MRCPELHTAVGAARLLVKGFEAPIEVWNVDGLAAEQSRDSLGELVGRRAELHQFTALLEVCQAQGRGHGVLVRGEPGIGKTRLVEEFVAIAMAKGLAVHKALVLDFGVGKDQDAIRDLTRSLLSIPVGSNEDERHPLPNGKFDRWALISEHRRIFLNDLLHLPQPEELRRIYGAMDPVSRNTGIEDTVCQLIATRARNHRLLIVIEDIHWAGQETLNHLTRVASSVAEYPALACHDDAG